MRRRALIPPMVLFLILVVTAAAADPPQDSDIAECVINLSQTIKRDCNVRGPTYDGGCGQDLGRRDPADNWSSRDHPHSGPFMDFLGGCDIPSLTAGRGAVRVRGTNFTWAIMKMVLYPASAAQLFFPMGELAVPPDSLASSQIINQWNCDGTAPNGGPIPFTGAYAKQFLWGQMSSNQELQDLAATDFTESPLYRESYNAVADGYLDLRGWDYNRETPGTLASDSEAWKKRWAIFHTMATGTVLEPEEYPVQPWWAATQVCEAMILTYIHPDEARRMELSFWDADDPVFNAAVDQIYFLTDGRIDAANDPRMIFWDVDVGVKPTSWGAGKEWMLRQLIPRKVLHD